MVSVGEPATSDEATLSPSARVALGLVTRWELRMALALGLTTPEDALMAQWFLNRHG